MSIRPLILMFTFTFCGGILYAQTKIRIRVMDENDQPLKFVRLTLSGANLPIETESNGEYILEFPPGKSEMVFYPPAGFERVSPPNGALVIPEDKTRTLNIWLARKGNENRELQTFTKVLGKKEEEKTRLKIENERLRANLHNLEADRQSSTALRDSLKTIVLQNTSNASALSREIADLQEAMALREQLLYKKIVGELVVYADRLKDLRDALPRVRDAFIDQRSMARFDKLIAGYNVARDSLLQNSPGYVEIALSLWGAAKSDTLSAVYKLILTDIHQQMVLPLNTTLIDQFRAVRAEEIRPAKARKKAEGAANLAFEKLNGVIPKLETNIKAALLKIEAALHQNH